MNEYINSSRNTVDSIFVGITTNVARDYSDGSRKYQNYHEKDSGVTLLPDSLVNRFLISERHRTLESDTC